MNKVKKYIPLICLCIAIILIIILFSKTASCQRHVTDIKSNFTGGLERTVNVYTANGDLIATYSGKIDLDINDGGYVKFDFKGKRYIYYNCFVESIADIK